VICLDWDGGRTATALRCTTPEVDTHAGRPGITRPPGKVSLFKLYVLNGQDVLFGFYPIAEHSVTIKGSAHAMYDLVGKDATLVPPQRRPDGRDWQAVRRGGSSLVRHDVEHRQPRVHPMTDRNPSQLLEAATHVLLDFDGPVCQLVAGYPAPAIAERLRNVAADIGVSLPPEATEEADPLAILQLAATVGAFEQLDVHMRRAEAHASQSADPTPGATEFLTVSRATGRHVAIVSNNSAEAIHAYLRRTGLGHLVDHVEGRSTVEKMKPHPGSLLAAVQALSAPLSKCILIGDSTWDIDAAHEIDVPAIGYANNPGKASRLTAAGADTITASMNELALSLNPPVAELTP
jgi:HAD superfamily hydrolase (TIGR01509 family)